MSKTSNKQLEQLFLNLSIKSILEYLKNNESKRTDFEKTKIRNILEENYRLSTSHYPVNQRETKINQLISLICDNLRNKYEMYLYFDINDRNCVLHKIELDNRSYGFKFEESKLLDIFILEHDIKQDIKKLNLVLEKVL